MASKTIGYARTASSEQDIVAQIEALKAAGCAEVYHDKAMCGTSLNRPGLKRVLSVLESGDTLKVDRLDRIARSVAAFSAFRASLGERKIRIVLLNGDVETTPLLAETAMKLMASAAESDLNGSPAPVPNDTL